MSGFRRPPAPKIKTPKVSQRKNLSKSIKTTVGAKRSTLTGGRSVKKDRKKTTEKLGTCYKNSECQGPIILKRVSKSRCKVVGGKSWKGPRGCQSIS